MDLTLLGWIILTNFTRPILFLKSSVAHIHYHSSRNNVKAYWKESVPGTEVVWLCGFLMDSETEVNQVKCHRFGVMVSVSPVLCHGFSVTSSVSWVQCHRFSVMGLVSQVQCHGFSVTGSVSWVQCCGFSVMGSGLVTGSGLATGSGQGLAVSAYMINTRENSG